MILTEKPKPFTVQFWIFDHPEEEGFIAFSREADTLAEAREIVKQETEEGFTPYIIEYKGIRLEELEPGLFDWDYEETETHDLEENEDADVGRS